MPVVEQRVIVQPQALLLPAADNLPRTRTQPAGSDDQTGAHAGQQAQQPWTAAVHAAQNRTMHQPTQYQPTAAQTGLTPGYLSLTVCSPGGSASGGRKGCSTGTSACDNSWLSLVLVRVSRFRMPNQPPARKQACQSCVVLLRWSRDHSRGRMQARKPHRHSALDLTVLASWHGPAFSNSVSLCIAWHSPSMQS